jgi:chaperonin GroES
MELNPLYDRVVIRVIDPDTRSPGGIVIPDNAKEKPNTGEVLAVGPGRILENGNKIETTVKIGERVVFGQMSGQKIRVHGEEVTILKEEDILAIIA